MPGSLRPPVGINRCLNLCHCVIGCCHVPTLLLRASCCRTSSPNLRRKGQQFEHPRPRSPMLRRSVNWSLTQFMSEHERFPSANIVFPTIRRFSAVAAGSALLAGALVVASPISPAQAATSATFSYTGSTTTWPVPSGVQKLTGTAQGGSGAAGGATAGKGFQHHDRAA